MTWFMEDFKVFTETGLNAETILVLFKLNFQRF